MAKAGADKLSTNKAPVTAAIAKTSRRIVAVAVAVINAVIFRCSVDRF